MTTQPPPCPPASPLAHAPTIPLLRPGIGATIYGNLPRDIAADIVQAGDFVTLHTAADDTDADSAKRVRDLGCSRVWLAIPANYLVRLAASKGRTAAIAEVRRCARVAVRMRAEVFELNGEGQHDGQKPGDWIPADAAEAVALAELAAALLDAAADELRGSGVIVMWTSHDMPGFRLPWGVILRRCAYSSPQHYPAQKGRTVKQQELMQRVARSAGRWDALADRGDIPAEHVPGGAAWVPYFQGHGHTVGALVWGLCEAPVTRLWAYPGSWSTQGTQALRAARRLRELAGFGPDAVERFQAAHRLGVDGMIGDRTLSTLRATLSTAPGF